MLRDWIIIIVGTVMLLFATVHAHAWTLVWDASTGNPDGYVVEISEDGGSTWPFNYSTTETRLPLDDKCNFNATYSFRVSAYNAAGISAPCEPLTWTRPPYLPPADNPLPAVNTGPPADVGGPSVQ